MLRRIYGLEAQGSPQIHSNNGTLRRYLSSSAPSDFDSFRRQESIFACLNLTLIVYLLLIHIVFTLSVGNLTPQVVITLLAAFIFELGKLAWLYTLTSRVAERALRVVTWWSIGFNTLLTLLLMVLTRGEDSQWFILMAVPVVEAAFRLSLAGTIGVIALANLLNFFEAFGLGSTDEYLEAAATSLIYALVGLVVWLLVNNLREHQDTLQRNLIELEHTRERLLTEEKLAAIGRLSSAVAHEIRNPVAMIASSLATANRPEHGELARKEMFAIAATEAERLERLTRDFLSYAKPRTARIVPTNVANTLNYVAAVARAHAEEKDVRIRVEAEPDLEGDLDTSQIHQALLNLVLNAVDACKTGDTVTLGARNQQGRTVIEVADPAGPIPPETVAHLFEPFFTTKSGGTGLGLAIARNIAREHKGNLVLSTNEPSRVCFSIEIPARAAQSSLGAET
jgi:signal transduction histidine kinase